MSELIRFNSVKFMVTDSGIPVSIPVMKTVKLVLNPIRALFFPLLFPAKAFI